MARKNAAGVLAEGMLAILRERREKGGGAYPCTVRELAEQAGAGEEAALVLKAAGGKKPFGEQAVVLQPKNLASPVALKGDERVLLADDRTLLFLMELMCSESKPTVDPSKLKAKTPKGLQETWNEVLAQRLEAGRLPAGVAVLTVGRKRSLHLTRYPLPRPAEEVIVERMIDYLRLRRTEGDYPVTLAAVQKGAAPGAAAAVMKKAIGSTQFKEAVVFGMTAKPSAPIALAEDRGRLVTSDLLLLEAIRAARSGQHQVVNVADLKKKVMRDLQSAFGQSVAEREDSEAVPQGVGVLMQKKSRVYFLLEDVVRGGKLNGLNGEAASSASSKEGGDFGRDFDAAFLALDVAKGGRNFVSLVDLRARLNVSREEFDAGLRQLRQEGRYTLSASEGRHGLTAEELEAGIREEGTHFLYVSRRD